MLLGPTRFLQIEVRTCKIGKEREREKGSEREGEVGYGRLKGKIERRGNWF